MREGVGSKGPKYLRDGYAWSVALGESDEYRQNWERVFGPRCERTLEPGGACAEPRGHEGPCVADSGA